MEKLLSKGKCVVYSETFGIYSVGRQICGWVFSGMVFNKNINGRTLFNPSIALTFSSNVCIIPDRLLPSRACFRLYRQGKGSAKYEISKKKSTKFAGLIKNHYFCKLKIGLKNIVNLFQDLNKKCKLFSGRLNRY